jgi:hypothetical protein
VDEDIVTVLFVVVGLGVAEDIVTVLFQQQQINK